MNKKVLFDLIKPLDDDLEVFVVNYDEGNTYRVKDVYLDEVYDNDEGDITVLPVGTKVITITFKS